MVCICMLMAYLLLWLRSKYRSVDLCQGGGGGGVGGVEGLGLQGLYSATNCVVTIMNKQQNKQKL